MQMNCWVCVTRKALQGAGVTQILRSLIGRQTHSTYSEFIWYVQARKLRKLQNENALLNRLAKKFEILPEGVNLSFSRNRSRISYCGAFIFLKNLVSSCWPWHLSTTKSESLKSTNQSFLLKKTTSLHSLHGLLGLMTVNFTQRCI